MALTIGRVGASIALADHHEWNEDASGNVSLSVWSDAADTVDASFLREQLLGLGDPRGEPFVPVSVGTDPDRDGWYQVRGVKLTDVLGATELRGDRIASVSLRRLPYRVGPRYEVHRKGTVWTNAHSITESTYKGLTALPSSSKAVDLGLTATVTRGTRESATGQLAIYTTNNGTYDTVVSAYVPIGDAYDGAATIEVDVTGSGDWRTVVGTDIPFLPTRWRLSNGSIRVSWNTTAGAFEVEAWKSSAWVNLGEQAGPAANYFKLTDAAASYVTADPVSVDVLKNDPLMCIVRLVFDYDSAKGRVFVDLAVRRGDRNIMGIIKSRPTKQWGVEPTQAVASTAATGCFQPDANDNQSNRWVISSPKTYNLNTGTGAWRLSTADQVCPFAIGAELNGTSASGQSTGQNVAYQYYSQPNETLFVARN